MKTNKYIGVLSALIMVASLLVILVATSLETKPENANAQDGGEPPNRVQLHLGGDALFCDGQNGCWLLTSNGQFILDVAQSVIDENLETACSTETYPQLELGEGTFGPVSFQFNCYAGRPPHIILCGYDEHDKRNCTAIYPNGLLIVDPTPPTLATNTLVNTATATSTDIPTNTATNTPTNTPTNTATNTPTNTPTNTATNTPTDTPVIIIIE